MINRRVHSTYSCHSQLATNAFAARQNETVLRGSAIEESGAPASFATAFLTNAEGNYKGTGAGKDARLRMGNSSN